MIPHLSKPLLLVYTSMDDDTGSSKILDLQHHFVAAYVCLTLYVHSVQKETQTFKRILFRVKVIDFQNISFSVGWSFNKELYNRVSSKTILRVLFLGVKV